MKIIKGESVQAIHPPLQKALVVFFSSNAD